MKVAFSFLAGLALVAGLTFAPDNARAGGDLVDGGYGGCYGEGCGAYLVPAPNPIPLRRLRPVPAPGMCAGPGCANSANAYAVPPRCGQAGCGGTAMLYYPKRTYAYWKQPLYTACFPGPGNCYWRRDCWYDSFGRRFCKPDVSPYGTSSISLGRHSLVKKGSSGLYRRRIANHPFSGSV